MALFELAAPREPEAAAFRIAMTGLLIASLFYYRWYLAQVPTEREPTRAPMPSIAL
jgi:hypothetical protein